MIEMHFRDHALQAVSNPGNTSMVNTSEIKVCKEDCINYHATCCQLYCSIGHAQVLTSGSCECDLT